MIDFTTVVGLDQLHVRELEVVSKGWRAIKPEIFQRPLLAVCEGVDADWWRWRLKFLHHPNLRIRLAGPRPAEWSQREYMLTAIVRAQPTVETPWFLKIDTDTHATKAGPWINPAWFKGQDVFVTNPWGYTKPASLIGGLDEWALGVPQLAGRPAPVELPSDPDALVRHSRIISWLFFGRTDFADLCLSFVDEERLPCPSQDTFAWYVAARLGKPFQRVRMKKFGWDHRRVKV